MARMENVLAITALRAPAYAQSLLAHWLVDDAGVAGRAAPAFTALRAHDRGRAACACRWLRRSGWAPGPPTPGPTSRRSGCRPAEVAERLLVDAGVLVSPGYQFGPGQEGRFRVCYARDEAEWAARARPHGGRARRPRPAGRAAGGRGPSPRSRRPRGAGDGAPCLSP